MYNFENADVWTIICWYIACILYNDHVFLVYILINRVCTRHYERTRRNLLMLPLLLLSLLRLSKRSQSPLFVSVGRYFRFYSFRFQTFTALPPPLKRWVYNICHNTSAHSLISFHSSLVYSVHVHPFQCWFSWFNIMLMLCVCVYEGECNATHKITCACAEFTSTINVTNCPIKIDPILLTMVTWL